MKIDPLSNQHVSPLRRKGQGASPEPGGFAGELETEAPAGGPVGGKTSLGPVDTLLALQEVPESLGRDAEARAHGWDLLEELDQLRLGLLGGALPRERLERLARLIAERRNEIDDPRLAAVVEEIELRAAVELAKLGH